jgi:hypothetical protein
MAATKMRAAAAAPAEDGGDGGVKRQKLSTPPPQTPVPTDGNAAGEGGEGCTSCIQLTHSFKPFYL